MNIDYFTKFADMRLRNLLWPLGLFFGFVTKLQFLLYSTGILKRYTPTVPTIVVGNLRVGGTGKTPLIAFIAHYLASNSVQTAVLSRGYKRQTKGFILLNTQSTASQVGDEPKMLSLQLPTTTLAVCENRVEGIQQLMRNAKPTPEIILLDDAFQHHRLKASTYILTTAYHHLFTNDYPMPHGWLRESKTAAKRAQLIVITKCPETLSDKEKIAIVNACALYSKAKCVFSYLSYAPPINLKSQKAHATFFTDNSHLQVVTAIAHAKPMIVYIKKHTKHIKHHCFPDHHTFTHKELTAIYSSALAQKQPILCTEKDAVKLPEWFTHGEVPCYILPVQAHFNETDKAKLFADIQFLLSNFAAT